MKHQVKNRKFGRKRDERKAFLKSLMSSLIKHEKIETTEARAKEIRSKIEKFVTRAKIDNLANRRFLAKYFQKTLVKKMTEELGPKYLNRKGGYTRVVKSGFRRGDGSDLAVIEFV
ncbi:50S ribosomal protein L17 [Patescibacteria group bacterium]|nr:50S ribosomal protein L17 [Patescibacteria group bacterium]